MRERRREHGQALVEFALVIPVFLLVVFGLIDLGRFVFADSVLSQAAREGARVAAVEANWLSSTDTSCGQPGGQACPASVPALVTDIRNAANGMVAGLGGTIATVYVSCDAPGSEPTGAWIGATCISNRQGNVVSVRIVFTYNPITPVVGPMIGPVTRQAASSMVIN